MATHNRRRSDPGDSPHGSQDGRSRRGFAAMDPEERREIARMGGEASHEYGNAHEWDSRKARESGAEGGRAAHHRGTAHEWDSEQAREAGRLGGRARWAQDCEEEDDRGGMTRFEAGRRGTEERWGRRYDDEDEGYRSGGRGGRAGSDYDDDDDRYITRGRRESYYDDDDDDRAGMSRSEAGRRGAKARRGRSDDDED